MLPLKGTEKIGGLRDLWFSVNGLDFGAGGTTGLALEEDDVLGVDASPLLLPLLPKPASKLDPEPAFLAGELAYLDFNGDKLLLL